MTEQIRDELARRAEEADTSAAVRQRVLAGVAPRRRGWVTPVLGAAAAVLVTVGGLSLVTDPAPDPGPDPAPSPSPVVPEGWREESWGDLTVSVPDDWGWGPAPVNRRLVCGSPSEGPGYVGRPVMLSDVCTGPRGSGAPYVWLGADLEAGETELFGGVTQETVELFGTTLTVATDDPGLRRRIIDSARRTDLCPGVLADVPQPAASGETDGWVPDELVVCGYRRDERDGPVSLVYGAHVDDAAMRTWENLTDGRFALYRCAVRGPDDEWVVLRFSDGSRYSEAVYDLGSPCPAVRLADERGSALMSDMVRPWAVGGIPFVLYGPTGGKGAMLDSFIGGWG